MGSFVLSETRDNLAVLTLNRPESLNSLHIPFAEELLAAVESISKDDSVRAVLIKASGKHFCVGGDIKWFSELGDRLSEGLDAILAYLNPFLVKLYALEVPVVTAVQGNAAGAGVGLALAGDIVYASESVKLFSSYTAIGLSPDAAAVYAMARRVGAARAKSFFMDDNPLDADKCLELGVVNYVLPEDQLVEEAEKKALKFAQAPTLSMKLTKRLVDRTLDRNIEDQLALEREFMARCGRSHDGNEGIRAFLEKRKPEFTGK